MSIIVTLLLAALGGLCARELLIRKFPATRNLIAWLERYETGIGIAGIVIGVLSLVILLLVTSRFPLPMLFFIVKFAGIFLLLAAGLITGFERLRGLFTHQGNKFLLTVEKLRALCLPYREKIGVLSLVFAVLYLFLG
jgi:hypothetical protein